MSLDNESRRAMVAYRIEKADVALEDAAFLTDAGRYGLAANRLFVACASVEWHIVGFLLSHGVGHSVFLRKTFRNP